MLYPALSQQGNESLKFWYYLKSISHDYLVKFNDIFKEEIVHLGQLEPFEQLIGIVFSDFPIIITLFLLVVIFAFRAPGKILLKKVEIVLFVATFSLFLGLRFLAEPAVIADNSKFYKFPTVVLPTSYNAKSRNTVLILDKNKLFSKILSSELNIFWVENKNVLKF